MSDTATLSQSDAKKDKASTWFKTLQEDIIDRFERLEDEALPPLYRGHAGRFELKEWQRGHAWSFLRKSRSSLL